MPRLVPASAHLACRLGAAWERRLLPSPPLVRAIASWQRDANWIAHSLRLALRDVRRWQSDPSRAMPLPSSAVTSHTLVGVNLLEGGTRPPCLVGAAATASLLTFPRLAFLHDMPRAMFGPLKDWRSLCRTGAVYLAPVPSFTYSHRVFGPFHCILRHDSDSSPRYTLALVADRDTRLFTRAGHYHPNCLPDSLPCLGGYDRPVATLIKEGDIRAAFDFILPSWSTPNWASAYASAGEFFVQRRSCGKCRQPKVVYCCAAPACKRRGCQRQECKAYDPSSVCPSCGLWFCAAHTRTHSHSVAPVAAEPLPPFPPNPFANFDNAATIHPA
jgi:hypothetical protein